MRSVVAGLLACALAHDATAFAPFPALRAPGACKRARPGAPPSARRCHAGVHYDGCDMCTTVRAGALQRGVGKCRPLAAPATHPVPAPALKPWVGVTSSWVGVG